MFTVMITALTVMCFVVTVANPNPIFVTIGHYHSSWYFKYQVPLLLLSLFLVDVVVALAVVLYNRVVI